MAIPAGIWYSMMPEQGLAISKLDKLIVDQLNGTGSAFLNFMGARMVCI
jgi:hypothetical protein